jgi:chromosomal replication initiator protein
MHTHKKYTIEISLREVKVKEEEAPLLQYTPSIDDVYRRAGLNPKYTFDNFAVFSTNQVAFAAAQAVADNPGTSYNPLFFYGGVGVGKTHLAQSVARTILQKNPEKKVFFCPGDQFMNELVEGIREKTMAKFRRKYRNLDFFIVDDVQFIAGKPSVQEELFHTFNTIVSNYGQIILTSDRPPAEIKSIEDRLRSRFSGGLIVDIQPPDFELRTAILTIKAREKNIGIDIEAAKIIAENISDTRALEGALLSIGAKIWGKKEVIDLEVVEAYFGDQKVSAKPIKKVSPQDVIKVVCSYYDIKSAQIKSPTRIEDVAKARQIIMYILREEFKLKLEEVAFILKRKDHTTIIHGVDKIQTLCMKDAVFKSEVDTIIQTIRSST